MERTEELTPPHEDVKPVEDKATPVPSAVLVVEYDVDEEPEDAGS